jgi:hypothetical protein
MFKYVPTIWWRRCDGAWKINASMDVGFCLDGRWLGWNGKPLEASGRRRIESPLAGKLQWPSSPPLLEAVDADGDQYYSVKDPSVVRHDGRWHVFFTMRGKKRSHQIGYVSFPSWEEANRAPWNTLRKVGVSD